MRYPAASCRHTCRSFTWGEGAQDLQVELPLNHQDGGDSYIGCYVLNGISTPPGPRFAPWGERRGGPGAKGRLRQGHPHLAQGHPGVDAQVRRAYLLQWSVSSAVLGPALPVLVPHMCSRHAQRGATGHPTAAVQAVQAVQGGSAALAAAWSRFVFRILCGAPPGALAGA